MNQPLLAFALCVTVACTPSPGGGGDGGGGGGDGGGGGGGCPGAPTVAFSAPAAWTANFRLGVADAAREVWLKVTSQASDPDCTLLTEVRVTGPVHTEGTGVSTKTKSFGEPTTYPQAVQASSYMAMSFGVFAPEYWQAGEYTFEIDWKTVNDAGGTAGTGTATVTATATTTFWEGEDVFQVVSAQRSGGGVQVNLKALAAADRAIATALYLNGEELRTGDVDETETAAQATTSVGFDTDPPANSTLAILLRGRRGDGREYLQMEGFSLP